MSCRVVFAVAPGQDINFDCSKKKLANNWYGRKLMTCPNRKHPGTFSDLFVTLYYYLFYLF